MKTLIFGFALMLAAHLAYATDSSSFYGKFEGELVLKPLKRTGAMQLVNKYAFIDSAGGRWEAPAGTISDGASIPSFLWSIVGDPWGADYRNAAVIHDVACKTKDRPWEAVHLTFYYAMLTAGVSETKANILYQAVYRFGPRWGIPESMAGAGSLSGFYSRAYDYPALPMTQDDYRVIKKNVDLLSRVSTLSTDEKIAVLQIHGELDAKKVAFIVDSRTPRGMTASGHRDGPRPPSDVKIR